MYDERYFIVLETKLIFNKRKMRTHVHKLYIRIDIKQRNRVIEVRKNKKIFDTIKDYYLKLQKYMSPLMYGTRGME